MPHLYVLNATSVHATRSTASFGLGAGVLGTMILPLLSDVPCYISMHN